MTSARQLDLVNDLCNLDSETPWVEFKENNFDPDTIGKNVSAIANSSRLADRNSGFILWGVRDDDHEIVGTSFQPGSATRGNQPLHLWLCQMLDPVPHLDFQVIEHPSGKVVLLEVPAATQSPVKFNREAFIRVGSSTTQISRHPDTERRLWSSLQPYTWESGIALQYATSTEVLELIDYPSYFELIQHPLPDNRGGILDRLESDRIIARDVGERWNVLNLGALLFAKRLDRFDRLSRKAVRVIEYEGADRTRTHRRHESSRGYASGFLWLVDTVNSILPRNEHIGRAFREVQPVYPEIAIRELVANALIHQDMTIMGAGPLVEVFSDRIEITNPGAPLNEPSRLIDLPPRSRNEAMAALMRRMNICEEQGSGLDKVISLVELFQLPPPDFRVDGGNMKVILLSPRQFAHMTAAERVRAAYQHAVLRFLMNEKLTNASLRARFGIENQNAAQVSRILRETTTANLIRLADPESPRAGYVPHWA